MTRGPSICILNFFSFPFVFYFSIFLIAKIRADNIKQTNAAPNSVQAENKKSVYTLLSKMPIHVFAFVDRLTGLDLQLYFDRASFACNLL